MFGEVAPPPSSAAKGKGREQLSDEDEEGDGWDLEGDEDEDENDSQENDDEDEGDEEEKEDDELAPSAASLGGLRVPEVVFAPVKSQSSGSSRADHKAFMVSPTPLRLTFL